MISAALLTALVIVTALGPVSGRSRRAVDPIQTACRDATPTAARRRHVRPLALAASVLLVALVVGLPPATALLVGAGAAPRVRRLLATRASQQAIDAALPDAIEMLVLVIQTGMTPHQGIDVLTHRAPAPVRPAFIEVRHRVDRGAPLADALDALPDTLGPGASAVADTLALAERHGTPIAQALEQLALDVRERRRRQTEADARKLPIRMSFPLVVCTLPSFVLIAIVPAVLAAMASLGDTGF